MKPDAPRQSGPGPDRQDPAVDILGADSVRRLAQLAFGRASGQSEGGGRQSVFLEGEALELDLGDPEQCDFGDYELLERLGQGGTGVVYRARQRSLRREVALKLLAAGPWASPEFVGRFRREAQNAARLQHPGIVPIFEIGSHAELNFFAMALIRGRSLAQMLESGPMRPVQAARLLRTVAEAIDYAHRMGILHLDLKPANILLDENGEPLVADFGLARTREETLGDDGEAIAGTPGYMAPEQVRRGAGRIGAGTDIHGLGAILYETLSGRPPYLAATAPATLVQVVEREIDPTGSLGPGIPRDLQTICLKCLAKDVGQRYPSARALADDLGRFLEGRPVSVRPLPLWERAWRWSRREPRVAAAGALALSALLLGLVGTSLQWRRADANAAATRAGLWTVRSQAVQNALAANDGFRALRSLVANLGEMEASGDHLRARLERQRIGTVLANAPQLIDLLRLPPGESVTSIAVAPDGKTFAVGSYAANGSRTLRQFSVDTGDEQWARVTDGVTRGLPFASTTPHGLLRYSADGSRLLSRLTQMPVFAAPSGADGIALDARSGRVLMPPDLAEAPSDIVYSDDVQVALVRFRSEPALRFPDSGQFYAVEPWQPLGPRLAFDGERAPVEWLPAPDGRWFLGTSDFCSFELVDPRSGEALWRLRLPQDDPVRAWRFSADGSLLALGTMEGRVYLVDPRDASRRQPAASPVATVRWLEFSADGRTLAGRSEDGTLVAWELPSLRPRMPPVAGGGSALGTLRSIGDRLYSGSGHSLRSWTLPPMAAYANVAIPAPIELRNRRHVLENAFDGHPAQRLLVAGGSDGYIGLWREAAPPILPAVAAPLPPRAFRFEGERVAIVEQHSVRVIDTLSLAPQSAAFHHPEPITLAELGAEGRLLVTVAGRTVRVLDTAEGALRGAAIVLPQSPLRADLDRGQSVILLGTAEYMGDTFHERLHVVDLERARLRPVSPLLPGPVRELLLGPQGRFALAIYWPDGTSSASVQLVDLTGMGRACGRLQLDAIGVGAAALADDGRTAWFYLQLPQRRGRLSRWDLDRCTEIARIDVQQGSVLPTLRGLGEGVLAHRLDGNALSWFQANGSRRDMPGLQEDGGMQEFAVSDDGARVAVATRNAVKLIDLQTGESASGLLAAPIAGNDAIAKLAFSPDATRLLARTVKGRWLHWSLPVSGSDLARLERLARTLDPTGADPSWTRAEFAELRQQLREASAASAPGKANAPSLVELPAVPDAGIDARFLPLDLSGAINVPLSGAWPRAPSTGGDRPTVAPGVHRLLGIDWRIEGGIQLSWGGAATALHPTQRSSAIVPVPALRLHRVHVLTHMHIPIRPQAPAATYAHVVLIDRRGGEHRLPIRLYEHVVTHRMPGLAWPSARIGWAGIDSGSVVTGYASSSDIGSFSFAVSLEVPAGIGPVVGLRLETGEGSMEAPLFHAVTVERMEAPIPLAP